MGRQAKGSLTISDIRLPIKREFMSRIGGPHGESYSPPPTLHNGMTTMGRQAKGLLAISDIRLPIKREFIFC